MRQIANSAKERQLLKVSEGDITPSDTLNWSLTPKSRGPSALRLFLFGEQFVKLIHKGVYIFKLAINRRKANI